MLFSSGAHFFCFLGFLTPPTSDPQKTLLTIHHQSILTSEVHQRVSLPGERPGTHGTFVPSCFPVPDHLTLGNTGMYQNLLKQTKPYYVLMSLSPIFGMTSFMSLQQFSRLFLKQEAP